MMPVLPFRLPSPGWRDVLIALLALAALVQTLRIEIAPLDLGPLGEVGPKGFKARIAGLQADLATFKDARDAANREALAARASEELALKALSQETDNAILQARAEVAGDLERFIAAGGLPDRGCPRRPAAPGPLHGAGDGAPLREAPELDGPAPLPELPEAGPAIVRVSPEDVRICTANTILAEEWRDLLLGLEARGED